MYWCTRKLATAIVRIPLTTTINNHNKLITKHIRSPPPPYHRTMSTTNNKQNTLVLFDVDGTLTAPRLKVTPDMLQMLQQLREKVTIGIVGGSDLVKQVEQLGESVLEDFDYVFSENGLMAYHQSKLIGQTSIKDHLGEEALKQFINFVLIEIATLDIPVKRGTFIEFRNGMLNVSPIGRNCSQQERCDFEKYDLEHKIRDSLVKKLQEKFAHLNLRYSIGGQISFDVFPEGWDKTFCLRYVKDAGFSEIHFFGDKTFQGGNDYEIFESEHTVGHSVTNFKDTMELCQKLFLQ